MATRIYREGDDFPTNTEDMKTAPGPLTKAQRLGKMSVGAPGDVTAGARKKVMRDMPMAMDPVSGEEVSMERVTKKKFSSGGSASSRADGIAKRGKTRGTMVMCGGGYAKKGK